VSALWSRYGELRAASSASASGSTITSSSNSASSNSGDSGLGTDDSPVRIAEQQPAFCYSVALAALLSPCATSTSVASSSSSAPAPHIDLSITSPDDVLRTIATYCPILLTAAATSVVAPAGSSDAPINFNFIVTVTLQEHSQGCGYHAHGGSLCWSTHGVRIPCTRRFTLLEHSRGVRYVHTRGHGRDTARRGQGAAARVLLSLSAQEWAATSTSTAPAGPHPSPAPRSTSTCARFPFSGGGLPRPVSRRTCGRC